MRGGRHQECIEPCHNIFRTSDSDEDWYPGTTPHTQKAQGGICYDSAHHPEDSKVQWHAS
jgi:hypothetical protein